MMGLSKGSMLNSYLEGAEGIFRVRPSRLRAGRQVMGLKRGER